MKIKYAIFKMGIKSYKINMNSPASHVLPHTPWTNRRGKITMAKKLYKHIHNKIGRIRLNFNKGACSSIHSYWADNWKTEHKWFFSIKIIQWYYNERMLVIVKS